MKNFNTIILVLFILFTSNYCGHKNQDEHKKYDFNNFMTHTKDGTKLFSRYFNFKHKTILSFMLIKQRKIKNSVLDFRNISRNIIFTKHIGTYPYSKIIKGDKLTWDKNVKKWKINRGFQYLFNNLGEKTGNIQLKNKYLDLTDTPEYLIERYYYLKNR